MSRRNSKELIINKRRTTSSESIDSIESRTRSMSIGSIESRSMSIGSVDSISFIPISDKEEIKKNPRKVIIIEDNRKRRVRDADLEYVAASPNISYFKQVIANNAWVSKK